MSHLDGIRLVLASASPRRLQLLRQIGIEPLVEPAHVDETMTDGTPPEEAVVALAESKAREIADRHRGEDLVVLGADTLVVVDGTALGKPEDDAAAAEMLRRLSGRTHQVVTGVAVIATATGDSRTGLATTEVRMRPLADDEIAAYVASGEPRDKAGAYAIQGRAAVFVEGIVGDHSNVVGLPLPLVDRLLAELRR